MKNIITLFALMICFISFSQGHKPHHIQLDYFSKEWITIDKYYHNGENIIMEINNEEYVVIEINHTDKSKYEMVLNDDTYRMKKVIRVRKLKSFTKNYLIEYWTSKKGHTIKLKQRVPNLLTLK